MIKTCCLPQWARVCYTRHCSRSIATDLLASVHFLDIVVTQFLIVQSLPDEADAKLVSKKLYDLLKDNLIAKKPHRRLKRCFILCNLDQ